MKYAVLLFALAFAPAANATTWYVDTNVAGGANSGTSWTDAFADLQQALVVALPLDYVWVAAGEYIPTAGADRTISFIIPDHVSLYGGFAGDETDLVDRDWISNPTVLSGDIGVPVDTSDNSYHVIVPGAGTTLDGFTVQDGHADGPTNEWRRGAGISIGSAGVTIRHCIVTRNRTGSGGTGAGLYTEGDDATVEDCELSHNEAAGSFSDGGGAAAAWGATTSSVFRRVVFRSNTAGSNGGGLFQGSLAEDCSFFDNQSVRNGGGSHWVYTVADCYYEGNSSLGGGGAAYGAYIYDSTFTQNTADTGGGIYAAGQVQRCQVFENTAEDGGGVYLSIGGIHNSVLFDNSAINSGGGMFACTGCANGTATNLTIVNNTAALGGGIAGSPNMINSIVWGNQAPIDPSFHASGFVGSNFSFSLIEGSNGSGDDWLLDGNDGGHNIDADPLFMDAAMNDFQITWESPAFGAGSNSAVVGETDAQGNSRIRGSTVDMGAYEGAIVVSAPAVRPRFLRGYPNPFNPAITIEFALPSTALANVSIYNIAGQAVRTLWNGPVSTVTQLGWDGTDESGEKVGSGVYFARLVAPGLNESMKLVMLK